MLQSDDTYIYDAKYIISNFSDIITNNSITAYYVHSSNNNNNNNNNMYIIKNY